MKKAVVTGIIATASILSLNTVAFAGTFASNDGKVKVNTEYTNTADTSSWYEISDPSTKITLTDGQDKVEITEFARTDALPAVAIAGNDANGFKEVYQTFFSNGDSVFVVTGKAVDGQHMKSVRKVIEGISFDGTEFKTEDYSSKKNTQEEKQEEKKEEKKEEKAEKTGKSVEIYYRNSNAVTVYEYTDGSWKDENGVDYWRTTEGQWANEEGSVLYDYVPEVACESDKTGNSVTLYFETGNTVGTVYEYKDGRWLDGDGVSYTCCGDYWVSSQGCTLYDHELSVEEMRELHDNENEDELSVEVRKDMGLDDDYDDLSVELRADMGLDY